MPSLAELSDPGYSWWDLYNVSNFYHSLGHDVFILSMPLKGINLGPGTTDKNLISSLTTGGSCSGKKRVTTRCATSWSLRT